MDLELRGKVALVTGASKGIRLACAETLAAEGSDLHLVARTAAHLDAAAERLERDHAIRVTVYPVDLAVSSGRQRLAAALPALDIVVNNAGAIPGGDLERVDQDTWRGAWELKVVGYIDICRLLLPRLEAQGSGVIINIIGAAGQRPKAGYIAGGTGNAALMALTQALGSHSLRRGVRVVGVNPGLIATDRLAVLLQQRAAAEWDDETRWRELLPYDPPPGSPRHVADLVAFLASPRAEHISGTIVTVDGGASSQ
jgi:NAD(P)-dependent dehydrogenase (short-subunit alcohol dehydrogenase family)